MAYNENAQENEFVIITPTKLSEIVESDHDKMIIKFGAAFCGPCRELSKFVKSGSFKPIVTVTIYEIHLDQPSQKEVSDVLSAHFKCRSIPHCVVVDKSLNELDTMTGYSQSGFISFVKKNFYKDL